MTRPAITPSSSVTNFTVSSDLNVGRDARINRDVFGGRNLFVTGASAFGSGLTAASGVAFYGAAPIAQRNALTAPAAAAGGPLPAFTDPPSAAEMAALRTFVNNIGGALSTTVNSVSELRTALGSDGTGHNLVKTV